MNISGPLNLHNSSGEKGNDFEPCFGTCEEHKVYGDRNKCDIGDDADGRYVEIQCFLVNTCSLSRNPRLGETTLYT